MDGYGVLLMFSPEEKLGLLWDSISDVKPISWMLVCFFLGTFASYSCLPASLSRNPWLRVFLSLRLARLQPSKRTSLAAKKRFSAKNQTCSAFFSTQDTVIDPGQWVYWLPNGWKQGLRTSEAGKTLKCRWKKKWGVEGCL